ncbi:MAG: DegV family protein [Nocardioidaceae bacterium]|nr:DegV family protein [Nocardioidaceae bacterium]MCL2614141.1 DegV family protein [Nocardioidaceae bacterium]
MAIALVTDSTAELSPECEESLGVTVVPLQVVIDDASYDAGSPEVAPEQVAAALRAKRAVSTSRPAPAAFAETYERLAAEGADAIVSVHLSGEVSGTFESAQVAARQAPVPVTCVDTRQVGFATGFAVAAAAAVLADGGSAEDAAKAAQTRAEASRTLLYVDTLEYLRRGGRVGTAAAVFGGALAVKPLLGIENGVIAPVAKVRTAAKAIARLEDLAIEIAGDDRVEIAVAHLAAAERAEAFAERLAERLGESLVGQVRCAEIGGVVGAHVGPGMIAVCVSPLRC